MSHVLAPAVAADVGARDVSWPAAEFNDQGQGLNFPHQGERWRELFPLPHACEPSHVSGLSVSSRRRRARVRDKVRKINSIVDSLNEMYVPDQVHVDLDVTEAQRACHHSLFKQLSRAPRPQDVCSEREAVQELLRTTVSYEQADCMNTVRPYDRDLVSLPEVGAAPVALAQVLDATGREFVEDPATFMLLDDEEWGMVLEHGDTVRPYMDERLQKDTVLYSQFVQDLYDKGMLSFTHRPQEIVPPFFVHKKNGRQRLILDCRAVNKRFKKPPPLALGAGSAWSQVSIPEDSTLYLAQSDIKDYFYSLALPTELQPLFCLPAIDCRLVQDWGKPELCGLVGDAEGWVFPMLQVVPMGWSWAMWLSQRVHQHLCLEASGLDVSRIVVEGRAAPDLSDGEVILIPYADNLNVAGLDPLRVQEIKNVIVEKLRRTGFRVHEELEACEVGQSLGFRIDGRHGVVSPIPERLQRVKLALKWLSRQPRVRGREVERLLGHCIHFMLLRREFLSIFRGLYDFIQQSYDRRQVLFAAAAKEARWASHLLDLCTCDLKRSWSTVVTASDASLSGIAVCRSVMSPESAGRIGSQREPWRYRYKNRPAPRAHALDAEAVDRLDPFSDTRTVLPSSVYREDPFELNEEFQEVPMDLLDVEKWHEAFAVHMRHPEHITLLEGRGVVASFRHKFRSVSEFGKKHLHLNDNMAVVLMCSKGRSGAFPMLRVCRRICALLVATDSFLSTRWIPSEYNIADKGSRRWEHLRREHAAGRSQGEERLKKIYERCYPGRSQESGVEDFRTGQASCASPKFQAETRGVEEPKGEGREAGATSSAEDRPSQVCGSDQSGEISSITSSCPGLCQKDSRFPKFCQDTKTQVETNHEVRRSLLLVSKQYVRPGSGPSRRHKALGCSYGRVPRLWPQECPAQVKTCPPRMAKGGSASHEASNSLAAGGGHGHEDGVRSTAECCTGSLDDVHGLLAAQRVSESSKKRPGETNSRAPSPCYPSASLRKTRSFQSRAVRREHTTGLKRDAMVGDSTRASELPGSLSARSSVQPSGVALEEGIDKLRPSSRSLFVVSAEACGSITRSTASPEIGSGGQAEGPVGIRFIDQTIRGTRQGESRVLHSAKSGSRNMHCLREETSNGGPKVFLPTNKGRNKGHCD